MPPNYRDLTLIHPIDVQPFPGELVCALLAVDPGMAIDPTGLAAARVGLDRGAVRITVDLLAEMPSPCPAEAIAALVEAALQELWSSLNNLALLPLLERVLPAPASPCRG